MNLEVRRPPRDQIAWRGVAEVLVSTPFVSALLVALTWPIASPVPSTGPDSSWTAGLYMGLTEGLHFGTQFVFAYGPLGFLEQPVLYDPGLWAVALLYRAAIYFGLTVALLWSARRLIPLLPAVLLVYGLLVIGYMEAASVLLAFTVCAACLSGEAPARSKYLVAVAGAALGSLELLAKLNFGLTILALCLVALVGLPERRRTLPLFAATIVSTLGVAWFLTGQGLGNVSEFVSHSTQILGGYSDAMATNVSDVGWQRPWAVFSLLLLVAAAASADARDSGGRRLALTASTALFGFAMLKQSFVRQGLGNAMDFFPLMLGAAVALAWQLPVRFRQLPPHALAVLLIGPLAVLSLATLPRPSLWGALQPSDHVKYLRQDLKALASGSERTRLSEEGAARMRARYRIDSKTLKLLRDRTIAVAPWEIGAAWAYGLNWQPLPVIQGYQAYTPELDSVNAGALAKPGRPAAILVENTASFGERTGASIDDRLAAWDPPAAARATLCHYRAARTTARWQVLLPSANRCGPANLLETVPATTDRPVAVPVPPPQSIVFATIDGLGVEAPERLRSFLYRARSRFAVVNGKQSWRIVPGTLGDGLIMRAARGVDFPAPFELAPRARTVSFHLAGGKRQIEIRFYFQKVAGRPANPARPRPPEAAGRN